MTSLFLLVFILVFIWGTTLVLVSFFRIFQRSPPTINIKVEAQNMSPENAQRMVSQAVESALTRVRGPFRRPRTPPGQDFFSRLQDSD